MYHTAWTRKAPPSTLPSDRIRPNAPPPSGSGTGKKSKGTATPPSEPPKSRPVRQLEALIAGLTAASAAQPKPDPKGGCFCQARAHTLSPYTAICKTCGLVLCIANAPQHSCPSCRASLLSDTQRTALVARLQTQLAETLAGEDRARAQAAAEARRAVGAFPTLSGTPAPAPPPQSQQSQTRTVLSLNSKTKRITVSAYSPASSAPSSRPASPSADPELDPPRIPPPPSAVAFVSGARVDASRPYLDLSGNGAVYVPPPDLDDGVGDGEAGADGGGTKKKRRRGRGKGDKGKENAGGGEEGAVGTSTS
ncbi:hypothetical protein C8F01DRAFT_1157777 [Mycena amicta]|nr:hypothetical protein C8F01DRAFT_1157777 [Mycena amicta]